MMKAQVEAMQAEEAKAARIKQEKARQMLLDVEVANEMQKNIEADLNNKRERRRRSYLQIQ